MCHPQMHFITILGAGKDGDEEESGGDNKFQ